MSWIFYHFEDQPTIGDFKEKQEIFTIEHFYPQNQNPAYQAEFTIPELTNVTLSDELQGLIEGVTSISPEEVQKYIEENKRYPFKHMERYFVLHNGTSLNSKEYGLELTSKAGLIRRVWTRVPQGNITHAIYKCAGRGDSDDFLKFAQYAAERLPQLSHEIISPRKENVPDYIWKRIAYAGDTDWASLQGEFNRAFYEMFARSVAYSAVEPAEPFRIDGKIAKKSMEAIAHFRNLS